MSSVPVDRATPQITEPQATAEDMVTTGNETINKIKASPSYAAAADVQAAVAAWSTATAALGTNNAAKVTARAQLELAVTNEPALVRRYQVRRNAVLTAISAFADGSKQVVQSFGTAVEERKPAPLATVPANLRPFVKKQLGVASLRWDPTEGASGYFRVLACDPELPNGQSPYSAWLAVLVGV